MILAPLIPSKSLNSRRPTRPQRRYLQLCLLLALSALALLAQAAPLPLNQLPDSALGLHSQYLLEDTTPLTLQQVQQRQQAGEFQPGQDAVLNFGIGARPVWLHLQLLNPHASALRLELLAGTTWIDQLDVFVVHPKHPDRHWHNGDAQPASAALKPAQGYSFELSLAPGSSDLYIRAATREPLVLPIQLFNRQQASGNERWLHYSYGFLYGFLLALIAYNGMLYAGLRERSYLYYSLYLSSLILLNMAYTGHGYAWLWSTQPALQHYVGLVLMVLYSCFGLLFACRFLALAEHAPRVLRFVQGCALLAVSLLVICVSLGSQLGATLVAFSFMSLFTLGMVLLGILTVHQGRIAGRYFLLAALCGMLGAATTTFTVWGWLPFNAWSYRALELGILFEATLLALALSYRLRQQQQAQRRAERLADLDPLTGLHNRRGFLARANACWSIAERKQRPLSLIMLDLDHFKQINDQHGHLAGDQALQATAQLLTQACRAGDILARWGGEEFLLLLPESNLEQARVFAERLRQNIAALQLSLGSAPIHLTASFGVAERNRHLYLEELIDEVDVQLYAAKQNGRNRVAYACG